MTTVQILISSLLAIVVLAGISMMSRVRTAVAGNLLSAMALLCGIVATLLFGGLVKAWTIWPALIVGALIGSIMARRVKMIQMPQTVALFNGLGGGASALVGMLTTLDIGVSSVQLAAIGEGGYEGFVRITALLAVAVGMTTLVGSLVAAGKLHRLLPQKPLVWKGHDTITAGCLLLTLIAVATGTLLPAAISLTATALFASLFGLYFAVRVGGADMPITISLLNSLSGVAGAIAGMAIGDVFLVAVGGIVGASGLLLTQIMCRAMNRNLLSILLGGRYTSRQKSALQTAGKPTDQPATCPPTTEINPIATEQNNEELIVRVMELEKKIQELERQVQDLESRVAALTQQVETTERTLPPSAESLPAGHAQPTAPSCSPQEDEPSEQTPLSRAAQVLAEAKDVIIVPGYGMALAQAQHQVRQLADKLEGGGARVRYAIHPVAGRMPGHMNVLLAEADVDYEQLFEMEAINDDFAQCDAVVVVGANDVMNPAARHAEGTPIYGMPVLNVDAAPEVIVCNYDLKPGYAGVENPLYTRSEGVCLCLGDAKETLQSLIGAI